MQVAIIDDLAVCRQEIKEYLLRYIRENYQGEEPELDEFESGTRFLDAFRPQVYDVIFIDQYMDGLSGIETAWKIRQSDELVSLVFVTTSRDHAIDSYQVKAGGYLLKPFSYADFEHTLSMLSIAKIRNARFICLEEDRILLREILWCDVDGHYVQVHTEQRGIRRYRIPFSNLTAMLLCYPQFQTCYKGCIVNLDHVERLDKLDFLLRTGKRLPFSKRDRKKIEMNYHTYLFQKAREEDLL